MDELDDAADFIKQAGGFKESRNSLVQAKKSYPNESPVASDEEKKLTPGVVSQYALYGGGYMPTTDTIKRLPSGCYDIHVDPRGVFAVPALKPSGILLELPEMRSDDVIKLVETFWESEDDYKIGNDFVIGGAAYKAGIMIYGPPGTGKSCTIKIVSNKLVERGGTVFYASVHPETVMDFLVSFSRVESNRKCIVILEDIDSLIARFGESAYLEMLDSAKTIDNVLFVATTNYPDRLDPRIYNRPGRFSHVVKIGLPGPAARRAYLNAILKNKRDVDTIVENTKDFTIDHLSALVNAVYREKKNLVSETKRLRTLFDMPKSEEKSLGFGMGIGAENLEKD